jgi:phosphoribosylaminoimidazole carboxylase
MSANVSKKLPTNKVLGILGGGQLGRMLTLSAHNLGIQVIVLDPTPQCPAALVGAKQILGSFTDSKLIAELMKSTDVVTVEIEHVNADALLMSENESGISKVHPTPKTLSLVQDKYLQKCAMRAAGVPLGAFKLVESVDDVINAAKEYGYPIMLKSRKLAYDGRGNVPVRTPDEISAAFEQLSSKGSLYVEKWVSFKRELAVIVARSSIPNTDVICYEAVETVQRDSICHVVVAPAQVPGTILRTAQSVAKLAVEQLTGGGVFGVELFELEDGSVLFNEMAPRVHNSGHFSIEACETSQFEQHVRCVMGLPLGSTSMRVNAAVMINVLGKGGSSDEDIARTWAICMRSLSFPGASCHWYSKAGGVALGRKVGHITLTGSWMPTVLNNAAKLIDGSETSSSSPFSSSDLGNSTVSSWVKGRSPVVGIIMGSDSDLSVMSTAASTLEEFGVPYELTVVSAHRTPKRLFEYATSARKRGLRVIIAAAGGAAHLPGMVAAMTPLPVIGVPVPLKHLDGVDSLYSIVQMPRGVPVATVAIGNSTNGALLAVRILGSYIPDLADAMERYQTKIEEEVMQKATRLESIGWKSYN